MTFTVSLDGKLITQDVISLFMTYNTSEILSGSISINAEYDVNFYFPFFSAEESVIDTNSFNWQIPLDSSSSSFNIANYMHQKTTITYQITLEFGPYYSWFLFWESITYVVLQFGTHIAVPQLTS
ncbi:MAG: hypothetical protein ACYDDC_03615, partial [Thermoplasmataceae archaeon]